MWVWQGLGFENIRELPSGVLAALGCRCRPINTQRSFAASEASAPLPTLRDEEGTLLEMGVTGAGTALSPFVSQSTGFTPACTTRAAPLQGLSRRLAELGDLRFAIPDMVELATAADTPVTTVFDSGASEYPFASTNMALDEMVARGGGSLCLRAPKCLARLREEAQIDLLAASHMEDWQTVATGLVLGAELHIQVVVEAEGATVKSTNAAALADRGAIVVHDKDKRFRMHITQRGGPPLDPSKVHDRSVEEMGQALDIWVNKIVASRPETWQLLYAHTKNSDSGDDHSSSYGDSSCRDRPFKSFGGESRNDVALAAVACADLTCDPFELSYGDAHVHSMRCMLQSEIADTLGIPQEQVLCGPLAAHRPGQKRRHTKTDMVTLQFALLHSEMVELVRGRPVQMEPVGADLFQARNRQDHLLTSMTRVKPEVTMLRAPNELEMTRKSAVSKTASKPGTRRSSIVASKSLPTLGGRAALSEADGSQASGFGGQAQSVAGSSPDMDTTFTHMDFGSGAYTGNHLMPDQLVAQLLAKVSDKRHPMRKYTDEFPMLSRCWKNGFRSNGMLVADMGVVTPGKVASKLRLFMGGQRPKPRDTVEIDLKALAVASERRRELIRQSSEGADMDLLAKAEAIQQLSAKRLVDTVEASFTNIKILTVCLDELLQRTARNEDECVKHRSCRALEQLQEVCIGFKSDAGVIGKSLRIVQQLTKGDVGSVDRIWEAQLAPTYLASLANFDADHGMQLDGMLMLRRLFERAREIDQTGARVVPLGKNLDKVWTFRAVERIFQVARRFPEDATVQMEACNVLVTLAEMIQNNGLSEQAFHVVEMAMRKHGERPAILTTGTLIISRLGPSFLAHESRAFRRIVDSMARHRSNVEVQRVGTQALFSLSKQEDALETCRECGGVTATLTAMCAHSTDKQVTQMGIRTLEKLCPRALAKVMRLCGDITAVLPPVVWKVDPLDNSDRHVGGDLHEAARGYHGIPQMERPQMVESFVSEMAPIMDHAEQDSRIFPESEENEQLATMEGFRSLGIRDELDTHDDDWAIAGPRNLVVSAKPTNSGPGPYKTRLEKDLEKLEKANCDTSHLTIAGPTRLHLQQLSEAMIEGLDKLNWSAHDGELFGCLLGHFAWHSSERSRALVTFGFATALINWIEAPRFKEQTDPKRIAQSYAMQYSCIGALAVLCRQDSDNTNAILSLEGCRLMIKYSEHMDLGIRRCALRCLGRLIPNSSSRPNKAEKVPVDLAWPLMLRELQNFEHEGLQGAAASCVLEAIVDGWVGEESELGLDLDELAECLVSVLGRFTSRRVTAVHGSAVLPLLIAVGKILAESGAMAKALGDPARLINMLVQWLPCGATPGSTAVDRGVATASAIALSTMVETIQGTVLNASDLEALLTYGSSEFAHSPLRLTCNTGLMQAVAREESVDLLSKLFNTRLKRGSGSGERLADPKVLVALAERILSLLRGSPERASSASIMHMDRAEKLLPRNAEQYPILQGLVNDIRAITGHLRTSGSGDNSPARSFAAGSTSAGASPSPPRMGAMNSSSVGMMPSSR